MFHSTISLTELSLIFFKSVKFILKTQFVWPAAANNELKALNEFAHKNGFDKKEKLKAWDINYWSEILRKEKFNLDLSFVVLPFEYQTRKGNCQKYLNPQEKLLSFVNKLNISVYHKIDVIWR